MVGMYYGLNGHEFEQTLGDSEGQGSLACCSPWGHKESDTTERLNSNKSLTQPLNSATVCSVTAALDNVEVNGCVFQ